MLELLGIFDYITLSFLHCINSDFKNLRKNACSRDSKDKEGGKRPKKFIDKFIHFTCPGMQKVNRGSSRSVNNRQFFGD